MGNRTVLEIVDVSTLGTILQNKYLSKFPNPSWLLTPRGVWPQIFGAAFLMQTV